MACSSSRIPGALEGARRSVPERLVAVARLSTAHQRDGMDGGSARLGTDSPDHVVPADVWQPDVAEEDVGRRPPRRSHGGLAVDDNLGGVSRQGLEGVLLVGRLEPLEAVAGGERTPHRLGRGDLAERWCGGPPIGNEPRQVDGHDGVAHLLEARGPAGTTP